MMQSVVRRFVLVVLLALGVLGIVAATAPTHQEFRRRTPTPTRTHVAEFTRTPTPVGTPVPTSTPTVTPTVLSTTPTPTLVPPVMRVGFNVGGGHESVALDLAAINGSIYANFCCPLDTTVIPGATNIRILRYNSSCPTMVMSNCIETIDQLATFVAANPGLTWELGNEPGNSGQDSLSGVATWEKNVYAAIKGADPSAFVLGPGVLNWDSQMQTLYQAMAVDGVAFHMYPNDACMGSQWLAQTQTIIDGATAYATSVGKPVWMTETSDFPGCSPPAATRQANVAAEKAYLASHNVVGAIWFTEGDLNLGLGTGFLFNTDNTLTAEGQGWRN